MAVNKKQMENETENKEEKSAALNTANKQENQIEQQADAQNLETTVAVKKKVKGGKYVPSGIAYISATFNNTKVTFTDLQGNVICWGTAGKAGFKGSKKSTAYVAQLVANETAKKVQSFGMKECEVRINGPGAGRESAVRGIAAAGLDITALQDITPVPHNGCRPPKRRRV